MQIEESLCKAEAFRYFLPAAALRCQSENHSHSIINELHMPLIPLIFTSCIFDDAIVDTINKNMLFFNKNF
jgi:hypothetical protein